MDQSHIARVRMRPRTQQYILQVQNASDTLRSLYAQIIKIRLSEKKSALDVVEALLYH